LVVKLITIGYRVFNHRLNDCRPILARPVAAFVDQIAIVQIAIVQTTI